MAQAKKLEQAFYDQSCNALSKKLLGKVICRKVDDGDGNTITLKGRITETEMYPGQTDQASHSYQEKKTKRNGAMFMKPGTAYVYNIYGMYCCFNVSSEGVHYPFHA